MKQENEYEGPRFYIGSSEIRPIDGRNMYRHEYGHYTLDSTDGEKWHVSRSEHKPMQITNFGSELSATRWIVYQLLRELDEAKS